MVLTRAAMAKLSREELEEYATSQDVEILQKLDKVQNELSKVNQKITKLESELVVAKRVNDLLSERMIEMERKGYSNEQYSRKECIEISGIPDTIANNKLESTVVSMLQKIGSDITDEGIEACHRISKNNHNVIMKLSRRKDCYKIHTLKTNLGTENLKELGITGKVYIHENLCPYYKSLRYKCKKLWLAEMIHSFWVSGGKIYLKFDEDGERHSITHLSDIEKFFPDQDLRVVYEGTYPPRIVAKRK